MPRDIQFSTENKQGDSMNSKTIIIKVETNTSNQRIKNHAEKWARENFQKNAKIEVKDE